MLSKREGRNYVIMLEDDPQVYKTNAKRTDDALKRISRAMGDLGAELKKLQIKNEVLSEMLKREVFERCGVRFEKESYDCFEAMESLTRNLKEHLETGDDDIPKEEKRIRLTNMGYTRPLFDHNYWSKTLERTEDKEVVEEILLEPEPVRRVRTTIWRKTDYGRESESITYRKKPIGKKLMTAIINTQRD